MSLRSAITVTRSKTWKGPCYVAVGNLDSFPGELETIIHPTTYAFNGSLTVMCPTTTDGATINRAAEVDDGIAMDQKASPMDEGEPTSWSMEATLTLLDTTVEMFKIAWETPDHVVVSGSVVGQKRLPIGAPDAFTERELYIVQEDPKTGRMRAWAFREAVPQVDSEINVQTEEATGLPVTFRIRADPTIAEHHGPFGFEFEEDA